MNSSIASLLVALNSTLEACQGLPLNERPAADLLDEVVSSDLLQALGTNEVPLKLQAAFATLDRVGRLKRNPESTTIKVTIEHVVLTCQNLIRALEAKQSELVSAAKAEAERIAANKQRKEEARTVRKAILAELSRRGVEHDPYASDAKLQAALVAAGGTVPKPSEAPKAEPAFRFVIEAPQPTAEAKAISPERAALLEEMVSYGASPGKALDRCSNGDLRFYLRTARAQHSARINGLRGKWEQANRAYQKMGRQVEPFPLVANSSATEIEAAEKRLVVRENFIKDQRNGTKRLERGRRGFFPVPPPTVEGYASVPDDEPEPVPAPPAPVVVEETRASTPPPAAEIVEVVEASEAEQLAA